MQSQVKTNWARGPAQTARVRQNGERDQRWKPQEKNDFESWQGVQLSGNKLLTEKHR